MLKHWWTSAVLMGVAMTGVARADGPTGVKVLVGDPQRVVVVEGRGDVLAELGEYWIGVVCSQADPALRAQLNLPEKHGLIVEQVSPDSPAAKAGVQQHDVLLKANDKPLGSVADLLEVINKVKDGKIELQFVRAAKQQTLTVTPAKRPAGALPGLPLGPGNVNREAIEKLLEKALPGEDRTLRFHILGPGTILPPGAPLLKLPDNMSITVTRQGSKPAQITVKQGEQTWEVSEKELDKLPEKVRPYVAQMLPSSRVGVRTFNLPVTPPGAGAGRLVPEPEYRPFVPGDMEMQLQDMNRRIEQLRKAVDEMHGTQPAHEPDPNPSPEGKADKKSEAKGS